MIIASFFFTPTLLPSSTCKHCLHVEDWVKAKTPFSERSPVLGGDVAGERINGPRSLLTFQGMLASPKSLPHSLASLATLAVKIAQFSLSLPLPKASAASACFVFEAWGLYLLSKFLVQLSHQYFAQLCEKTLAFLQLLILNSRLLRRPKAGEDHWQG
ncbi:hypothetical protein QPX08_10000 [Corynebacterium propinquum]|jgi:hypothetical protein|uniref:hypothetical protein n=1 Tax=Corynebacterium TaxID=1716 RepID=UPI000F85B98E|nr:MULTISPECIES: hypothetical protein [Corynebacterium]MCT1819195.1 hypothetical protein [Corynebacterium propinquum]MDK4239821.1 hypothetical protein [Corynebacterium propinquum]MDK8846778.1 hypothetical protein [Corynebacterium sp. MSK297]